MRILFALHHLNSYARKGTTDNACSVNYGPEPEEKDVRFIIKEIKTYLNKDINGLSLINGLEAWIFACFRVFDSTLN